MEYYYCPKCLDKLERLSGCGSVGYICNSCKNLISRKQMLTLQEMDEEKRRRREEFGPDTRW